MRKRLRKRRHIGEFREDGFEVKFNLFLDSSVDDDDFFDRFIVEIEKNSLTFAGGCGANWDIYVTKNPGSATESDREIIRAWLEAQPKVKDLVIGQLVDAWWGYGW